jgi:MFS family permease
LALGVNQIAALAGSFGGLILGGVLASIDWRWVFLVNVPVGILGTVWSMLKLREIGERNPAPIDWLGNITFGIGLTMLLVGITYGIKPYGDSQMGWGSPFVLSMVAGGLVLLVVFLFVERRAEAPMFDLGLFRIRAFAMGNLAALLAAVSRGGLQFLLIMWLQGIWLPLHGYGFEQTPLWAGIYMVPLTVGFIVAGPVSGWLSDHYGSRPFATAGMLLAAVTFGLLLLLPANFSYPAFAGILFLNGAAFGLFASPNTASVMNSVPARQRGAASGMLVTFQNTGFPLSIGIFFSLMILGLAASVPHAMFTGLTQAGVPANVAHSVSQLPPVGYLFAAFLGFNPLKVLLGPAVLGALPAAGAAHLTSREFFPALISDPFRHGLIVVLSFSVVMSLVAAAASWLRGPEAPRRAASAPSREQRVEAEAASTVE